jgi:hypothetical protein
METLISPPTAKQLPCGLQDTPQSGMSAKESLPTLVHAESDHLSSNGNEEGPLSENPAATQALADGQATPRSAVVGRAELGVGCVVQLVPFQLVENASDGAVATDPTPMQNVALAQAIPSRLLHSTEDTCDAVHPAPSVVSTSAYV